MDEKTYHVYSDKLALNVLDLNQIDLATEEDKLWKLDYWAHLFKASTWEDIRMIASNDEYLTEASNTLYDMHNDFNIRERLRSREDYIIHQKRMESELAKKDSIIAEKDSALAEKDSQINQLLQQIASLEAEIKK